MKKPRNIMRIDSDSNHTHAWLVRVQRQGNVHIKMFSDLVYGTKQKALKSALQFRDRILAKMSPYNYHLERRSIVRQNNTSGIPGVGRYENFSDAERKRTAVFWVAFWNDETGIRRQRKFSVFRYGERTAKKLAIAERERRLREVCAAIAKKEKRKAKK
jgi:hypothetical protein